MTPLLEELRPRYLGLQRSNPEGCRHQISRIAIGASVQYVCRHCGHGSHELVQLAVDRLRRDERRRLLTVLALAGLMEPGRRGVQDR